MDFLKKLRSDPVRILQICTLLYILGFLVLGQGSGSKIVIWMNFGLDIILCGIVIWINFRLWKSRISNASKLGWSLLGIFLIFFTWFAFLAPEAGLPPVLFA